MIVLKVIFIVWFVNFLIRTAGNALYRTEGFQNKMEKKYGPKE